MKVPLRREPSVVNYLEIPVLTLRCPIRSAHVQTTVTRFCNSRTQVSKMFSVLHLGQKTRMRALSCCSHGVGVRSGRHQANPLPSRGSRAASLPPGCQPRIATLVHQGTRRARGPGSPPLTPPSSSSSWDLMRLWSHNVWTAPIHRRRQCCSLSRCRPHRCEEDSRFNGSRPLHAAIIAMMARCRLRGDIFCFSAFR